MKNRMVVWLVALILVATTASAVETNNGDEEEVEFKHIVSADEKKAGKLNMAFNAHGENFTLEIEENKNIKPDDVPVMFVGEDGKPKLQDKPLKPVPEVLHSNKFYGGTKNGTMALLKRNQTGLFSGHVVRRNVVYEIQETEENTMKVRKRRDSPLLHAMNLNKYNDFTVDEDLHVTAARGERAKREASTVAGVESLVMVDYSLWQRFYEENNQDKEKTTNEIKQYFAYIIHGVDLRYQHIEDPDINIFLTLVGYVIADSPKGSPWYDDNRVKASTGRDQVNITAAYVKFRSYIDEFYTSLPAHDHAFSFSDLEFTIGGHPGIAGFAPIGGICSFTYSFSLTEAHGFTAISTAAHELGHNLGAKHDGPTGNTACNDVNYLMDPDGGKDNLQNAFVFSQCSINDFKDNLGIDKQCLKDKATHTDPELWALHLSKLPGQIYSSDEQCQDVFGQASAECGQWIYDDKGYDKCSALWCVKEGKRCETINFSAARGTDCGENKWCINGACVTKDDAHMTMGRGYENGDCENKYSCIKYLDEQFTCPEIVQKYNYLCRGSDLEKYCCKSCNDADTICSDNPRFRVTIHYSDDSKVVNDCAGFVKILPQYCDDDFYAGKCCGSCKAAGY